MEVVDTRSDEELAAAWLGGEAAAFAVVYDRYSDVLYSFAVSRLRNPANAADVVQDTFVRAAERLGQLRDHSRLRPWLYAIARNRVLDTARKPLQFADAQEFAEMPSDMMEPADEVSRAEVSELVWVAAGGLADRDRELLGLHLRHGLDGADLADVIGMTPSQVYVAMSRLKDRMAKAVGALLIARHGSADCRELSILLTGWDGTFSLDVRSKVTRHIEGCDLCSRRRAALIAPSNLAVGAFALRVAAPASLRESTLRRVGDARPPGDPALWRPDGFPRVRRGPARRTIGLIAAGTLVAAAVLVTTFAVIASSDTDDRSLSAAGDPTSIVGQPAASVGTPSVDTSAPPTTATETSVTTVVSIASTAAGPEPTQLPVVGAPATKEGVADEGPKTTATAAVVVTLVDPTATAVTSVPTTIGTPTSASAASSQPAAPPVATPPVSPAVEPSGTTAETATTVALDTTTTAAPLPPPPPPPPPGHVVVVSGPIDLGASQTSGTIRIRNDGGQAVGWSASSTLAAFSPAPASGSLEPGQESTMQVTVDRAALGEGSHTTSIAIASAGGGGSVTAAARVERAPVISSFTRTPPVIRTQASCGPTLTSVAVAVNDESGIASVEVLWSSDGSFAQRTTLTPNGSGTVYSGVIGSFSNVGSNVLSAQVLDVRGNHASSSTTVTVLAC